MINSILLILGIITFISYVQSIPLAGDSCYLSNYEDVASAAEVCDTLTIGDLEVPRKKTLHLSLRDGAKLLFDGHLTHVPANWTANLVKITGTNIVISGTKNHLLDGLGPQHWNGAMESNIMRPNFIRIEAQNATVKDLNIKNCPNHCVILSGCSNILVTNINIDNYDGYPGVAGEKYAKNTDGFDIRDTTDLRIENSVVFNQDDCVAVNSGSNMVFENLYCNGSHGLSFSVMTGEITNVTYLNSKIEYADHGIHVKTHNDGGAGIISNILYKNIEFNALEKSAVSIQQNYPRGAALGNVPITNLTLDNVKGSMTGKKSKALQIICAKDACSDWHFIDFEVTGANQSNDCQDVPSGITC